MYEIKTLLEDLIKHGIKDPGIFANAKIDGEALDNALASRFIRKARADPDASTEELLRDVFGDDLPDFTGEPRYSFEEVSTAICNYTENYERLKSYQIMTRSIEQNMYTNVLGDQSDQCFSAPEVLKSMRDLGYKRKYMLTGYPTLDEMCTFLTLGDISVIGGIPGTGKTAMALNLGLNIAMGIGKAEPEKVLIVSLENESEEIIISLLARIKKMSTRDISDKQEYDVELPPTLTILRQVVPNLSHIIDRVMEVRPKLVIIDYVQLLANEAPSKSNKELINKALLDLKLLAKDLGIHIMLTSQLNRSTDRGIKPPSMSDLKETGMIEQIAGTVILLHDEHKAMEASPPKPGNKTEWEKEYIATMYTMRVDITKTRRGSSGVVYLGFARDFQWFVDGQSKRDGKATTKIEISTYISSLITKTKVGRCL